MRSSEFIIEQELTEMDRRGFLKLALVKSKLMSSYQMLSALPNFAEKFDEAKRNTALTDEVFKELMEAKRNGSLTEILIVNLIKQRLVTANESINEGVGNFALRAIKNIAGVMFTMIGLFGGLAFLSKSPASASIWHLIIFGICLIAAGLGVTLLATKVGSKKNED